jgi:hypothetical protein
VGCGRSPLTSATAPALTGTYLGNQHNPSAHRRTLETVI